MKAVKIISGIVATILLVFLVWGILYLSIEPVKNWTDTNIFQIEETVDKEDDENGELPSVEVPEPDGGTVDTNPGDTEETDSDIEEIIPETV